jgi:hypothetical protein
MKVTKLIIGLCAISVLSCQGQNPMGVASVTVRVVDQDGIPVSGAEVRGAFEYTDFDSDSYKVLTDTNGVINASGRLMSIFNCFVKKDGYYESSEVFRWKEAYSNAELKDGKWQPWNPTIEIVLKEKKNPIPMISLNRFQTQIPVLGKYVEFDLFARDWLPPYGKGGECDLRVCALGEGDPYGDFNSLVMIEFPNTEDGLVQFYSKSHGSKFKSDYLAPADGFNPAYEKVRKRSDVDGWTITNDNKMVNYYFRIRTRKDEDGKIVGAFYGKIYGPINFFYQKEKSILEFPLFYLNPSSNDRNVEYDMKTNLAKEAAPPGERSNPVYSVNQP